MIEEILPTAAAWSEVRSGAPEAVIFDEEAALVGKAAEKRRREFATGRMCARAALTDLGFAPAPILQGERGAPKWPLGVVGSITHCDGYCAAAAGSAGELLTLGIDAEPDRPLPDGVLKLIALPEEIEHLRELVRARPDGPAWDRLLFCAKETVYKAWFPMTGRWLAFEQATIMIDPGSRTFSARLLVPGPKVRDREVRSFAGRWLARDDLILTTIAVPVLPS